jgi:hypothetical protein
VLTVAKAASGSGSSLVPVFLPADDKQFWVVPNKKGKGLAATGRLGRSKNREWTRMDAKGSWIRDGLVGVDSFAFAVHISWARVMCWKNSCLDAENPELVSCEAAFQRF